MKKRGLPITVRLNGSELTVLLDLCEADNRVPSEQLRALLLQEAQQRGLLPQEVPTVPGERRLSTRPADVYPDTGAA